MRPNGTEGAVDFGDDCRLGQVVEFELSLAAGCGLALAEVEAYAPA